MNTRVVSTGRFWGMLLVALLLVGHSAAQPAAPDMFVRALVDNQTPFIGQQINYIFRFYSSTTPPDFQFEAPDFNGFWRADAVRTRGYLETLNGRQYEVREQAFVLFPLRAGQTSIDPGAIRFAATTQTLRSELLVLEVRSLPDGAPAGFAGAVGQFSIAAEPDMRLLQQGAALTLRLVVRGTGSVEPLIAPNLPALEAWQVYPAGSEYMAVDQDGVLLGQRVFSWTLIALQPGTQTIPAVTFSYFDPAIRAYVLLTTAPIVVDVQTVAELTPEIAPIMLPAPSSVVLPLKTASSPIYGAGSMFWGTAWWLWLLPPLGVLVVGLLRWRAHQRAARKQSHSVAFHAADDALRVAIAAPETFGALVHHTINAYLEGKLGAPPPSLLKADLLPLLRAQGIAHEVAGDLCDALEAAAAASYGPVREARVHELRVWVRGVLLALDESWGRTS